MNSATIQFLFSEENHIIYDSFLLPFSSKLCFILVVTLMNKL